MGLALSTFVLLLLLTPGLSFRRFYFSGEFSKQYFKQSFAELTLSTILPSLSLHLLAAALLSLYTTWPLDQQALQNLLQGGTLPKASLWLGGVYIVCLNILGSILGTLSKVFVRRLRLDRKSKLFRFANEWHYILSGEAYQFKKFAGKHQKFQLVQVVALVKAGEELILYSGRLVDYVLSKELGVDRLYLENVRRRNFNDPPGQLKYHDMPGNIFVLPFAHIVNLHLIYYTVRTEAAPKPPTPTAAA